MGSEHSCAPSGTGELVRKQRRSNPGSNRILKTSNFLILFIVTRAEIRVGSEASVPAVQPVAFVLYQ